MSLNVSGYNISDIYVGDDKIDSIFVGEDLVYSSAKPVVPFYFEVIDPTQTATVGFKRQAFTNPGISYAKSNSYSGSVADNYADMTLEYSYDCISWSTYTLNTNISLGGNNPQRVYFKKEKACWYCSGFDSNQGKFGTTIVWTLNAFCSGSNLAIGGNPNTMHNPSNARTLDIGQSTGAFHSLFFGCTNIVDASELDLNITLSYIYYSLASAAGVYAFMFQGCTSLVYPPKTIPSIKATYSITHTNSQTCQFMFKNCTSLIEAPKLPATDLVNECYANMFQGCKSLIEAPELPATTLANNCYYYMFSSCEALVSPPELPATTLATGCYTDMFQACYKLATPPELPATTLASACYSYMFVSCNKLNVLPQLPATLLANNCYQSMFANISFDAPVKVSTTQTSECPYPFRVPSAGTAEESPDTSSNVATIFGSSPDVPITLNTTYYLNIPTIS